MSHLAAIGFTPAFGPVEATDVDLRQSVVAALELAGPGRTNAIGLIGCGWIAGMQLAAYRQRGFNVVALCDRNRERALEYQHRYYPEAAVYGDPSELFEHPGLEVVDIATHVTGRETLIAEAIRAGKHVLSQKPFVEDLSIGQELDLEATRAHLVLAVNQNGRWAPHFAAMLALVQAGLIGEVCSADFFVAWPHDRVVEHMPAFASMDDLILFDFGAHWFDIIGLLAPLGDLTVEAVTVRRSCQAITAPTQASVVISGEGFATSIGFRGAERFSEFGGFRVSGSRGVISQTGSSLGGLSVTLENESGTATVETDEDWFSHGLGGAMGALLCAIGTGTAPPHSATSSLRGLELCFAALASARDGRPVIAGSAKQRKAT